MRNDRKIINLFDSKFVTFVSLITVFSYVIEVYSLKLIYNCSFNEVIIFNHTDIAGLYLLSSLLSALAFISGFILLFLVPGWIILLVFNNIKKDIVIFSGLSFIISIFSLISCVTLFKAMSGQILNRINITGIMVFMIFAGLAALWFKYRENPRESMRASLRFNKTAPYCILILTAVIFVSNFRYKLIENEIIKYDYSEKSVLSIPLGEQPDDLEVFGLAGSLKKHLLPYWDLEYADRFGFVFTDPPLYPFVCMFAVLLFGESKVSLILTSIGFIVCIFLIILSQWSKNKYLRLFICCLFLLAYLGFFLQDITSLIFMEHFFIFLLFVSFVYLLRRNYNLFIIFAAAATLTRFYAIFFILLGFTGLAVLFKERIPELKPAALKYGFIILGLILFIIAVGKLSGNLSVYWKTFLIEHLDRFDYFNLLSKKFPGFVVDSSSFSLSGSFKFLLWCFYGTALTFPILFVFGKDKEENFYSFVAVAYFTFVIFSRYQLSRYVIPLIPLTAVVVSSKIERWAKDKTGAGNIK